ncbi:beta-mannosidase [Geofilum rubicundum JCM 15548]|uniref:Beta-mannosidase n=2 Tax=Geofilum TaxID=1236988 RepID=A0A0E9LXJ5_9BACT|nr:beta-mannosidase [Geofilum rubicundum JCM 15548]
MLVNTVLAENDNRSGRFYLKASDGNGLHGGGPYHSIRPEEFFSHPKLHGFSSEIGASGVPVFESIERFMPGAGQNPELDRFPVDENWGYHDAANFPGEDTRKFTALDDIIRRDYGGPESNDRQGALNYLAKAQLQNYAAYRSAASAIGIQMWANSTGMLFWKSNSSWPSVVWQLYDWYQQAHAGYYGVKKAFAPFSMQFNLVDRRVSIVNAQYRSLEGVELSAVLLDQSLQVLWEDVRTINMAENTAVEMDGVVPELDGLVFLKLKARSVEGEVLFEDFYWLHAENDFSGLNNLETPELEVLLSQGNAKDNWVVTVENLGETPAILTRLKLVHPLSRHEILPALWSDNFISFLPGDKRELRVSLPRGEPQGGLEIVAEFFN